MTTQIDPELVNTVFLSCLFREEEVPLNGALPENTVLVEGIQCKFGFHHDRLFSHKEQVRSWLALLPHTFRKNEGGGWSFLEACKQSDDTQWTGLHHRMNQLFTLGIGLGLAKWLAPKEMWSILPGGSPYVEIDIEEK